MALRRFEKRNSATNEFKFWSVEVAKGVGASRDVVLVTYRWGRINTNGQMLERRFGSERGAYAEVESKIAEKLAKGYVLVMPPDVRARERVRARCADCGVLLEDPAAGWCAACTRKRAAERDRRERMSAEAAREREAMEQRRIAAQKAAERARRGTNYPPTPRRAALPAPGAVRRVIDLDED